MPLQVELTEENHIKKYISLLEREVLLSKSRERELTADRNDLVEKIRIIHGILEDKQRQVHTSLAKEGDFLLDNM